jgi:hypothetical protein
MQSFLSLFAPRAGKRRRRIGHLFQGRYRAELIEDEGYYWTVSRYIHPNPARAGLVERPEHWEWSSDPGDIWPRRALPWVATETLLTAWKGEAGGTDPAPAYRRFVEDGLGAPPVSPYRESFGGWVPGSERFVAKLRNLADALPAHRTDPIARHLAEVDAWAIFDAAASYYRLEPGSLSRRHDPHLARAVAAWLCRRYSEAPMREPAERFGLTRADSVPNLLRRRDARLTRSTGLWKDLEEIVSRVREGHREKRWNDGCVSREDRGRSRCPPR